MENKQLKENKQLIEELENSGEWNIIKLFNFGKCPGKPASTGLTIVQRSTEHENYLASRGNSCTFWIFQGKILDYVKQVR